MNVWMVLSLVLGAFSIGCLFALHGASVEHTRLDDALLDMQDKFRTERAAYVQSRSVVSALVATNEDLQRAMFDIRVRQTDRLIADVMREPAVQSVWPIIKH